MLFFGNRERRISQALFACLQHKYHTSLMADYISEVTEFRDDRVKRTQESYPLDNPEGKKKMIKKILPDRLPR